LRRVGDRTKPAYEAEELLEAARRASTGIAK
jgi:hypothetical protein